MKEWSDDQLDELFRKSAEEFEPVYQPNDWNDLSRRLDEADGVTGGGGWLKSTAPWLAGVLLLLLGGFGAYYYNSEGDNTQEFNDKTVLSATGMPATEEPVSAQPAPGRSGHESANKSEVVTAGNLNKSETGEADKNETPSQQKIARNVREAQKFVAAREVAQKIKELPRNPASVSGVRKPADPDGKRGEGAILLSKKTATAKLEENSGGSEIRSTLSVENLLVVKAGQNENVKIEASNGTVSEKSLPVSLRDEWPALSELSLRGTFQESDGLAYPAITYKATKEVDAPISRQATAHAPLWSVRIGIAPDLSMVRVSEMMKSMRPGPSASLLVDFNMSAHWALQTGVIHSLKTYNAQFGDYNGSEQWGNDPMPTNIDGDVRVFELPLNLRYDFGYDLSPRQKCLWFLGAGVSSYKMQRETYTYNYNSYSPGQKRPPKEMDSGTGWYFLSHANVSVGYEHRLTDRLSIIAEPYLRVPLRGVGWGKVNLFSAGVWFSARYTPVFRK